MARSRVPHEVDDNVIDANAQIPEIATFAKTLNQLLIEKHVHQEDLAQALGISTGSISSYRNGKKEPRLSMIVKIANYLGADCHYLMTGVKSENATFSRDACLSDKAAEIMKENKGTAALSQVLESPNFWRMLSCIGNAAKHADNRGEIIKLGISQALNGDENAVPAEDMDGFFKFAAIDAAGKLFDEVSERLYNEKSGS